tara:strand:- start:4393 stop:4605 length:213 start_codon:yes stop_codon:yes gene_type:complete
VDWVLEDATAEAFRGGEIHFACKCGRRAMGEVTEGDAGGEGGEKRTSRSFAFQFEQSMASPLPSGYVGFE